MPWMERDVDEQRVQFAVRAASGKESMAGLCREFGVSRPTGYVWKKRFEQTASVAAVVERSRRPRHSPRQTSPEVEESVVALRVQYGWGAKKLQVLLREQGTELPVVTINRILQRRGLVSKWNSHAPALQRFERSAPNELWQMDGKGKYRLREGTCYPLSILDDHSRYVVGLYGLSAWSGQWVQRCLVQTFEQYGMPEALLMDHDALWWNSNNGYGLTWLSVWLIEQEIRLYYGRVRHPQTQGKVERFHRTLEEALRHRGKPQQFAEWATALREVQRIYNQERPHEALGMQRPAERYRPSPRAYQAKPREWEYPSGSLVRRLNPTGCLSWKGEQWFVCEALAGRWVCVECVGSLLLISYRHMYVREVDRERRCTRALVVTRQVGRALRSPSGLPASPANPANPGAQV
jgi:transposase InsO family protein